VAERTAPDFAIASLRLQAIEASTKARMYPPRYIEDFSQPQKSKQRLEIRFRSWEGVLPRFPEKDLSQGKVQHGYRN
jgi:hypothetical protein